jgi:dolichyl-phosphate beta-glucosyltransferase
MIELMLEQFLVALAVLLLAGGLVFLLYPAIVVAASDWNDDRSSSLHVKPQRIRSSYCNQESSANNDMPVLLTLVIPAYEEEARLPSMLQAAYNYLCAKNCRALKDLASLSSASSSNVIVEWIVVNDGSKDRTSAVYQDFVQRLPSKNSHCKMTWKLISFAKNCGKGAAVQAGMLAATGDFCLMVDADGATDFGAGLEALVARLLELKRRQRGKNSDDAGSDDYPILLGSRAHLHATTDATQPQRRSFLRSFLMQAFHMCVVVFVGATDICDTQCGFKLFDRSAASHLFRMLHLRRWAFDTELLYLAMHLQYRLEEVVVPWQEIEGSKLNTSTLNLAIVSVSMLRDMICVRLCYTLGLWKIRRKEQ